MGAEEVHIQGPDGAVVVASRKAFEVCYRPRGFRELVYDPLRGGKALFLAEVHGGGRWRSEWPAARLMQAGWRVRAVKDWPWPGHDPKAVIVIHRSTADDLLEAVRAHRAAGNPVLVSVDDEIHIIPRANTGGRPRQAVLSLLEDAIAAADGLIVTTPRLAEVYGPLARQVWVVPNRAPQWLQTIQPVPVKDQWIRVGWMGSLSVHRHDMDWLRPAAAQMLAGAMLTVVGDATVPKFLGVTGPAEAWSWQKLPNHMYSLMARADIGIVPLDTGEDLLFNTSKSWIKSLEYVTLGIPVVSVDLPEHRRLLQGTGAGFLVSTPQEMAERVQQLVKDPDLRAEMSAAARALGEREAIEQHDDWTEPLRAVRRDLSGVSDRR